MRLAEHEITFVSEDNDAKTAHFFNAGDGEGIYVRIEGTEVLLNWSDVAGLREWLDRVRSEMEEKFDFVAG